MWELLRQGGARPPQHAFTPKMDTSRSSPGGAKTSWREGQPRRAHRGILGCPDTGRQGCMAHRAAAGMALCTMPMPAQRRVCRDRARARGCAVLWGWAAGPGGDKAVGLEEGPWDRREHLDGDEPWSQRARAATLLPFCRAHAGRPASHVPPLLPHLPVLAAPTIHPTIQRPAGRQPSLPFPGCPPSPLSPCRPPGAHLPAGCRGRPRCGA